jgi:hypothetical protein
MHQAGLRGRILLRESCFVTRSVSYVVSWQISVTHARMFHTPPVSKMIPQPERRLEYQHLLLAKVFVIRNEKWR